MVRSVFFQFTCTRYELQARWEMRSAECGVWKMRSVEMTNVENEKRGK